ncbi:MAG: YceI family protein [Bradymonadaceae bacterium]
MKYRKAAPLLFILLTLILLSSSALADDSKTSTLTIDSERSKISWVSEAPAEKIVGTGEELKGTIRLNLDDLEATKGTIAFPVSTMKTGNRLRDRHLQGKDWLNAKKNANVEFHLEKLENVKRSVDGDQIIVEADAVGQVEVNGVKAPNRAQVRITLLPDRKLARIQPTLKLALADHKVAGKRGVVGDKVGEVIEIEGVIYGNWE